jgi:BirA family biotin operon repressor/biotin-[acetyl-CoA-carboxylase] ligase
LKTDWRLTCYDSLPSTSDLCIERANAGEPEGLVVLARQQTAGRGSRGRSWTSAPGSLACSILLRPDEAAEQVGKWSLLAGVVLADTLGHFIGDPARISLKWPNDVLLDGRKACGILIDSALTPDNRLEWLVLGMGANLAQAPEVGRPVAGLGIDAAPEIVVEFLLARLDHWRDGDSHGAWLARAHQVGQQIGFRIGDAVVNGIFRGISAAGALLLEREGGRLEEYSAGEVMQTNQ